MKNYQKNLGVASLFLIASSTIFISCSVKVDAISKCKTQADPSYESILKSVTEKMSTDWESEYENIARKLFNDPQRRKLDFSSCLIDEGALCYIEIDLGVDIKQLLIERGWDSPTPWDCYWPNSEMVTTNPFS
jgi:hypothetical protein